MVIQSCDCKARSENIHYSPDYTLGVMLVRHTPRTAAVLAYESVIIVVHAVGARAIIAFPTRRIVVIVTGVMGHAVLAVAVTGGIAVNGGGGAAVVVAVVGIAAAVVVITGTATAEDRADYGGGTGVGRRRGIAGRGRSRRRARVQREKVLLQPYAHRVVRIRVVTQGQHIEALLGLPDV